MDKDRTTGDAPPIESRADKVKRDAVEKQKRLAEALRGNLQRRKAQSRARADDAGVDEKGRDGTPRRS